MSDSQVNFKVGDKVVRTGHGFPQYGIIKGGIYTVLNVSYESEDALADIELEEDCGRWYDRNSFKLYIPQQINTAPSELEEAYANIETLQEALEDAYQEIFSLKHQLIAKAADTLIGIEKEESQFKDISEMTLEDWELAKEKGWVFEMRHVGDVRVNNVEGTDNRFPVCFEEYRWRTLDGFEWTLSENRDDDDCDIIKRIK